jgi:hypothetical protein
VNAAAIGANRRANKTGTSIEDDVVAGVGENVESKEVIFFEMAVESIVLLIRNKGENVCFGLKTTTIDVAIMIMDNATIHRVRT